MNRITLKGIMLIVACFGSALSLQAQQINEEDVKINIAKIESPTAQLKNLEPISYTYDTEKFKNLGLPQGNQYGFQQESVSNSFPSLVQTTSKVYASGKNSTKTAKFEATKQVDLIPVLVAAIKEQQEQIELLKKEIELLKTK